MPDILRQPTLVLNRNWQPVHVASVQRALILLTCDAAKVVEPESFQLFSWNEWTSFEPAEGEPAIRSARLRVRVPEVVALVRFDRLPSGSVAFSKHNVFKRDRYVCQYCGSQPGRDELSLDHVVPRAQGGVSSWENCVLACLRCNHRKADRSLREAGMKLRRPPQRPTWTPLYARLHHERKSWTSFLA
jgi:5-methylcytosine-specific restriction endonuclease McrA